MTTRVYSYKMAEHFVGEVAQKAIIEHEGKILFVRSSSDSKWDLPGGRLNVGEAPKDGLKREVAEELGLQIEVGSPVYTVPINAPNFIHPRLFIFYQAQLTGPATPMKFQQEEVAEAEWFLKNEIDLLDTHAEWKSAIKAYLEQ
jgi:ADP-ribose pyrophosphatase YjhB (NUDIX family)